MVRFDNNWQRKLRQPGGSDFVHVDSNGRVVGRSMSANSYNQAIGLEILFLFVLWPAFIMHQLVRRWPGDLGKVKAAAVTFAIFPAAAFILGALGQNLSKADSYTYFSAYVLLSVLVWIITVVTWVILRVVRWIKYGSR